MRAIVGLMVLLVAGIVAIVGVLSNAGAAHPLTENFSLFDLHVTGATGVVFLLGIAVGAVASLGLAMLVTAALRTATAPTTPGSNTSSGPTAPWCRPH